ncbi:MAG: hypothetical protein OEQ53_17040, partial [Saprospiraceae bacterium]|nr:hypothetical protein [Saprospiraceae bacterium]
NYQGEIFPMDVVFTNGNWTGPLVPFETMSTDSLFHSSTLALPYEIRRPASVLVLQSHTGEALVHALENRVSKITGVEGNKTLVDMLKRELAGQTDSLLYRSEVNVIPLEARTYLSTDTTQADLIVLPVINVFGGASGISAIQEQYLFTKESFTNIWMRLSSSGMLTATTWIDHPSRDPLRLTNTMVELLEDQGIENAEQHLIAIKSWSTITFVLSKNRFADEEIASVRAFCRAESFDPVILLDMKVEERDAYHELEDSFFYQYIDSILSNGRQNFYDTYDFKIAPTTDDQPYFSQHLRLKSLPYLKSDLGLRPALFLELGYLLVLATFFQILILALILIVLPLSKLSFPRSNLAWTIFYFSGLGIGYMFVEIVFIQQFILYLGNAIYAATAVLSCLLLSSGLGSYYANRLIRKPGELIWCTAAILILLLLYSLIFTSSLQSTIGTDLPIKIGILILLTFPLGFLMGIPFPSGIALMSGRGSGSIPWAWGINGYFSVISTVLAMIISIEFGFSVLLILAAVAYALPMLAQLLLTPSP